eukprot:COSAG04_NODE_6202_length_1385_cov_2.419907_2_plen_64_part_00
MIVAEQAALTAMDSPRASNRRYSPAEKIFGSMRFGDEHGVVPMATELGVSLDGLGGHHRAHVG